MHKKKTKTPNKRRKSRLRYINSSYTRFKKIARFKSANDICGRKRETKIKLIKRGDIFYDITKTKDITSDTTAEYGQSPQHRTQSNVYTESLARPNNWQMPTTQSSETETSTAFDNRIANNDKNSKKQLSFKNQRLLSLARIQKELVAGLEGMGYNCLSSKLILTPCEMLPRLLRLNTGKPATP